MVANYMCGINKNLYDNFHREGCQTNKKNRAAEGVSSPNNTGKRRVFELSFHRLRDDEQAAPGVFSSFLNAGLQGQVMFAGVHFVEETGSG